MTRLADRMLLGCQPFSIGLMFRTRDQLDRFARSQISKQFPGPLDDREMERRLPFERARLFAADLKSSKKFDLTALDGVPIFVGDEVAIYVLSLPKGTPYYDVVSSMAPPFKKFFVEFQGIPKTAANPSTQDLYAWGCLFNVVDDPQKILNIDGFEGIGKPRWLLNIDTFLEREKGNPFGPVTSHGIGLAEDGTWFRHTDGRHWHIGSLQDFSPAPPDEINRYWSEYIDMLILPALLTISFLHCKNVEVRTVAPPGKLSLKHRKKRGRDLVRYHILDIKPMRRLLERHGTGSRDDLRRGLHICRGHFKTFTPDAPLWGRHIGTYWWAPQVRGSKSAGVVLKDYRVKAPSEFGRAYHDADENPPDATKDAPTSKDPDSAGRGLAAHNRTQNQIAEIIRGLGWFPRSPAPSEPDFDVAWKVKGATFVCEVKSLSPTNEERQLRIAVGQVIRYRQKLNAGGYEPVVATIATEIQPQDLSWNQLCENENIVLVWPQVAKEKFVEAVETMGIGKNP